MAQSEDFIHIKVSDSSSPLPSQTPRVKPSPKSSSIPVPFMYNPSDDGTDENLLILLHGLGDTHIPFAKLGRQFKLPQTATLALRAPDRIPFLYEDAFQWYTSFDGLGELITRPDPSPATAILSEVIDHLARDCNWPVNRIHMFGFGQGGSVAVQFVMRRWSDSLLEQKKNIGSTSTSDAKGATSKILGALDHFGSVVSVSGPMLSYPTILSAKSSTPVLVAHRPPPAEEALAPSALGEFKKAFIRVEEVRMTAKRGGMPASREEWEPIMKFWSEVLGRRRVDGLYEVMSELVLGCKLGDARLFGFITRLIWGLIQVRLGLLATNLGCADVISDYLIMILSAFVSTLVLHLRHVFFLKIPVSAILGDCLNTSTNISRSCAVIRHSEFRTTNDLHRAQDFGDDFFSLKGCTGDGRVNSIISGGDPEPDLASTELAHL